MGVFLVAKIVKTVISCFLFELAFLLISKAPIPHRRRNESFEEKEKIKNKVTHVYRRGIKKRSSSCIPSAASVS